MQQKEIIYIVDSKKKETYIENSPKRNLTCANSLISGMKVLHAY